MNAVAQYFLLYVDSPTTSANFYSRLLDKPPVELNPTFALFILDNGVKLGLWSRHSVEPGHPGHGRWRRIGFPPARQRRRGCPACPMAGAGRHDHPVTDRPGLWLHLCRPGPRRPSIARVLHEQLSRAANGLPG